MTVIPSYLIIMVSEQKRPFIRLFSTRRIIHMPRLIRWFVRLIHNTEFPSIVIKTVYRRGLNCTLSGMTKESNTMLFKSNIIIITQNDLPAASSIMASTATDVCI